jgi:hypothetical protein
MPSAASQHAKKRAKDMGELARRITNDMDEIMQMHRERGNNPSGLVTLAFNPGSDPVTEIDDDYARAHGAVDASQFCQRMNEAIDAVVNIFANNFYEPLLAIAKEESSL